MAKKNNNVRSGSFNPTPVTRLEKFLAAIAGLVNAPAPVTRKEYWMSKTAARIKAIEEGGGGGGAEYTAGFGIDISANNEISVDENVATISNPLVDDNAFVYVEDGVSKFQSVSDYGPSPRVLCHVGNLAYLSFYCVCSYLGDDYVVYNTIGSVPQEFKPKYDTFFNVWIITQGDGFREQMGTAQLLTTGELKIKTDGHADDDVYIIVNVSYAL